MSTVSLASQLAEDVKIRLIGEIGYFVRARHPCKEPRSLVLSRLSPMSEFTVISDAPSDTLIYEVQYLRIHEILNSTFH